MPDFDSSDESIEMEPFKPSSFLVKNISNDKKDIETEENLRELYSKVKENDFVLVKELLDSKKVSIHSRHEHTNQTPLH